MELCSLLNFSLSPQNMCPMIEISENIIYALDQMNLNTHKYSNARMNIIPNIYDIDSKVLINIGIDNNYKMSSFEDRIDTLNNKLLWM